MGVTPKLIMAQGQPWSGAALTHEKGPKAISLKKPRASQEALASLAGGEGAANGLPIEVRYGVPTEQNLHLWPEHKRIP